VDYQVPRSELVLLQPSWSIIGELQVCTRRSMSFSAVNCSRCACGTRCPRRRSIPDARLHPSAHGQVMKEVCNRVCRRSPSHVRAKGQASRLGLAALRQLVIHRFHRIAGSLRAALWPLSWHRSAGENGAGASASAHARQRFAADASPLEAAQKGA